MTLQDQRTPWLVYPECSYNGTGKPVLPDRIYKDLASIGLDSPVKSMRKENPVWENSMVL